MTFTLPDDIAIKLGAKRDPSQQPEAQPYSLMEESIPLWGKVQGTSAYQKRLNQAAAELYGMMEIDPTIQHYATTGKKVMINGKERGVIVPFTDSRRPKTIMALE